MFEPLLEAVRREISGERALDSLRALTRYHRVQASPGYDEAAEWLAGELAAAGLEPEIERVPGDGRTRYLGALMPEGWECSHASAVLIDGGSRERICDIGRQPLSLILRSAPARGRYPIVALEDGTEAEHIAGLEVRGKVVLTSGAPQRVHALAVVERGAAGIAFDGRRLVPPVRTENDDRDSLAYTSFWWNGDEPRGWGFVLSPNDGARMRERMRNGARLELEVEIESRRFATAIPLLSARLTGKSPRESLVIAHLCHPQPSANDNASGAAAALETARALAALRASGGLRDTARGVRFLWVPELTGTFAWLGNQTSRASRIAAALNLDMVGEDQSRCGSTLLLEHPPCFAGSFAEELLRCIRARALDWITSYSGAGHYSLTRVAEVPYSGGSDHAVFIDPAIGVPCPMLIQWPDRYYHSSLDTPDKSDPGSLALAARVAATFTAFVATAGEAECDWLLGAVARGARRRLLANADETDAPRRVESERVRAHAALGSLGRLGVQANQIRRAQEQLDGFIASELPALDRPLKAAASGCVPVRGIGAPLDHQRHLWPGYSTLTQEQRERLRRFDAGVPGGPTTLELAWYACDGERTSSEIADRVWLESGHHAPEAIAEFFEWTARLGLSSSAPRED